MDQHKITNIKIIDTKNICVKILLMTIKEKYKKELISPIQIVQINNLKLINLMLDRFVQYNLKDVISGKIQICGIRKPTVLKKFQELLKKNRLENQNIILKSLRVINVIKLN